MFVDCNTLSSITAHRADMHYDTVFSVRPARPTVLQNTYTGLQFFYVVQSLGCLASSQDNGDEPTPRIWPGNSPLPIIQVKALGLTRGGPANTTYWANIVLMLDRRLRRWPNIKAILAQRLVFAGGGGWLCWWSVQSLILIEGACSTWPCVKLVSIHWFQPWRRRH